MKKTCHKISIFFFISIITLPLFIFSYKTTKAQAPSGCYSYNPSYGVEQYCFDTGNTSSRQCFSTPDACVNARRTITGSQGTYEPLAINQVPGFENANDPTSIISNIYNISIGLGAILAVIMIVWSGMKYTVSEAVGGKEDAKEGIRYALLGLLLLLGSYIVLKTINVELVNVDLRLGTPPLTSTSPLTPVESSSDFCYTALSSGVERCFPSEENCNTAYNLPLPNGNPSSSIYSTCHPKGQGVSVGGNTAGKFCLAKDLPVNQNNPTINSYDTICWNTLESCEAAKPSATLLSGSSHISTTCQDNSTPLPKFCFATKISITRTTESCWVSSFNCNQGKYYSAQLYGDTNVSTCQEGSAPSFPSATTPTRYCFTIQGQEPGCTSSMASCEAERVKWVNLGGGDICVAQ